MRAFFVILLALFLLGCAGKPPEAPDEKPKNETPAAAVPAKPTPPQQQANETPQANLTPVVPEKNATPEVPAVPGIPGEGNETGGKTEDGTGGAGETEFIKCPVVRYEVCTQEYEPVCGQIYTDAGYYWKEFPNGCTACSKGKNALLYRKGKC